MYYYLCASLPSLSFGKPSAMSVADFDALCAGELKPEAMTRLTAGTLAVSRESGFAAGLPRVYAEYTRFEQYLRTRIAERRAGREEERMTALPDPEIYFNEVDAGLAAASASDPLEREKLIDQLRWRELEELEAGHDFDFDQLCVYRLKLAILDKYRGRNAAAGRENFNAAATRISGGIPAAQESK